MHNGKYDSPQFKAKQANKVDRLYGPLKTHKKICIKCSKEYEIETRENTKQFRDSKFCSRSCANNRQEWWRENATQYSTICFHHWDYKCIVCGFDKIVEVHHYDHNHDNNDPSNLVPLCPNHHQMMHSKWRSEVEPIVDKIKAD